MTELQNALACAARLFAVIDEPAQIPDAPDAAVLSDVLGSVALEHVAFSYVPEKKLIEDLNLRVQPGQRIAIVGPTGCGKTTLINLLMRFYDVDAGEISVEGRDIRQVTRRSLRASYGMVLQDTWLMSGTIRENICMGKSDATEEEMIAAAKAAHADSFIRRLPEGYDTVITEDGGSLSQGQKQLLCIARVMLCLPPMLILDQLHRYPYRAAHSGSLCPHDARTHKLHRRPPALHHPRGGCDPGHEGRPYYRAGEA